MNLNLCTERPGDKKVPCPSAWSGFPLGKGGARRNGKESSFLKDLCSHPGNGNLCLGASLQDCFPFTSSCQKAEDGERTFGVFCLKKQIQTQQPTFVWLETAFSCPKAPSERPMAASHAALARVPPRLGPRSPTAAGGSRPAVLQIVPVLCRASSGARPRPLPARSPAPWLGL